MGQSGPKLWHFLENHGRAGMGDGGWEGSRAKFTTCMLLSPSAGPVLKDTFRLHVLLFPASPKQSASRHLRTRCFIIYL